jgi:Family of unknown function (DUF5989)
MMKPADRKGVQEMSFLKELYDYLVSQRKFWLIPLVLVFVAVGLLFFVSQGSVVAPFIYTLF